ncbi:MAG: cache domain-containing protein [Anaerolineales bacterium]
MEKGRISRFFSGFFGGRLITVLITSFVFVAILTAVLNTAVISRLINNYLAQSQADRVARDMNLANGLYQQKLQEVEGIGERTASDPQTITNLDSALQGNSAALGEVDQVISRKITVPSLGSSELILILDRKGNILIGRVLSSNGELSSPFVKGNWGSLPIVADSLSSLKPIEGTEVLPAYFLNQVTLEQQAFIPLRETSQASPQPYDTREGTGGLALVSVYPLRDEQTIVQGMVVTAYLFNNDFSFVDFTTSVGNIETMTVFLGDLRISTNVLDANGARAVGTRVSEAVYNQVLLQGQSYVGPAFVVNDWYIGRYLPLRDHQNNVVGMLYVGAREADFNKLVNDFNIQVALIALVCIGVAGVIAVPIARLITQPLIELVDANHHLAKGELNVRVQPYGRGEIAMLGRSFNSMVETLSETQRALIHKDKLASMGQLAAGVAHELNNPLGTIMLYSDVMYRDAQEDDPRREDLKMIINEAYRCKIIVADLLNFARQQEVMAQDTNLNALLQDVVDKLRNQPSLERLELRCRFDSQLPLIQADPAQLQQVFINLINNSADAIEGPGTVTVSTHIVSKDLVEVRVTDSGSGIAPENLDKLFTPFFTTKPAGKGTGLGLAIVYGIVKMHRGQINVESKLGDGATVIITLPVHLPDGQVDRSANRDDLIT